jgi:hypothetical protein
MKTRRKAARRELWATMAALCLVAGCFVLQAAAFAADSVPVRPIHSGRFDRTADRALLAMEARAAELKIQGVAVVAYFDGDNIQSWISKMIVVGRLKDAPPDPQKAANLLAVAYSKASEMADTLKNSGSHARPVLVGEFGWTGGAIARGRHGYVIAAFSGGKNEDDLSVSTVGIVELRKGL